MAQLGDQQGIAQAFSTFAKTLHKLHLAGFAHGKFGPKNPLAIDFDSSVKVTERQQHRADRRGRISVEARLSEGFRWSIRSDLRSLGICLRQMIGDTSLNRVGRTGLLRPLEAYPRPRTDTNLLNQIAYHCTGDNPFGRYSSALELAVDLDSVARGTEPRQTEMIRRNPRESVAHYAGFLAGVSQGFCRIDSDDVSDSNTAAVRLLCLAREAQNRLTDCSLVLIEGFVASDSSSMATAPLIDCEKPVIQTIHELESAIRVAVDRLRSNLAGRELGCFELFYSLLFRAHSDLGQLLADSQIPIRYHGAFLEDFSRRDVFSSTSHLLKVADHHWSCQTALSHLRH